MVDIDLERISKEEMMLMIWWLAYYGAWVGGRATPLSLIDKAMSGNGQRLTRYLRELDANR